MLQMSNSFHVFRNVWINFCQIWSQWNLVRTDIELRPQQRPCHLKLGQSQLEKCRQSQVVTFITIDFCIGSFTELFHWPPVVWLYQLVHNICCHNIACLWIGHPLEDPIFNWTRIESFVREFRLLERLAHFISVGIVRQFVIQFLRGGRSSPLRFLHDLQPFALCHPEWVYVQLQKTLSNDNAPFGLDSSFKNILSMPRRTTRLLWNHRFPQIHR